MPAGAYCSHCCVPVDAKSVRFAVGPGAKGAEAKAVAEALNNIWERNAALFVAEA